MLSGFFGYEAPLNAFNHLSRGQVCQIPEKEKSHDSGLIDRCLAQFHGACRGTAPHATTEVAADIVKVDRYPAHSVTFPNGVKGIPGMVYWEPVGYRPLTLDLYLPPVLSRDRRLDFPSFYTSMAEAG